MSQELLPPSSTRATAPPAWRPVEHQAHGVPTSCFNWPSLALAASAAAAAITVYMMSVPRWLGIEQMDIGITIGGMADPAGGPVNLAARLAWHILNGLAYVPVYAWFLWRLQKQSTLWTGTLFGIGLWFIGPMTVVPLLLDRPRIGGGDLDHPGVFMLRLGLGWTPALVDLGAHLTHGILAGIVYRNWKTAESVEPTTWFATLTTAALGSRGPHRLAAFQQTEPGLVSQEQAG